MDREEILRRLRTLRWTIEQESGSLTQEQVCLLSDVCRSLGLYGSEISYVVGPSLRFIDQPLGVKLEMDLRAWEGVA